jgi:hypothetical protein
VGPVFERARDLPAERALPGRARRRPVLLGVLVGRLPLVRLALLLKRGDSLLKCGDVLGERAQRFEQGCRGIAHAFAVSRGPVAQLVCHERRSLYECPFDCCSVTALPQT